MTIGDLVTLTVDITKGIAITGRIVKLAAHYIIIETSNGEREIGNRMNARKVTQ